MGVQSYSTRLALGRSAYEPLHIEEPLATPTQQTVPIERCNQQLDHAGPSSTDPHNSYVQHYDARARPQNSHSRALARRSRRAQNDVLATVGVLLRPDQNLQLAHPPHSEARRGPTSAENYHETRRESALGFGIAVAHQMIHGFLRKRTTYARQRMQTFRFYTEVPIHRALTADWRALGPSLFILGGLASDIVTVDIEACLDAIGQVARWTYGDDVERQVLPTQSRGFSRLLTFGAAATRLCLRACFWSMLAPFRFHSALQALGLLPLWPLHPDRRAFIPFSAASLIRPVHFPASVTLKSGLQYLASVATAPVVLWCLFHTAYWIVTDKICTWMHLALLNPNNLPMSHPLLPAIDRRTGIVQGITFATDGTGEDVTIRRQAEKNWTDFCKYLESCSSWWGSFINGARGSKSAASDSTCETVAGLREDPPGAGILSSFIDNSHANARVEQAEMTEFALSGGGMASAVSALDFRQAGSQREINPPVSLSGSNEWQANVEGSELIISPPSWKSKLVGPSQATYHVTRLTTLAAGTLTVSLSKMLADILLLPLEALFIRSVALAYLDTADGASYAAMGLRQEIYPLGSWFGTALRGGRAMDYVRKMTLCFGLDMLLGFGAWQVTAGAAWWVGQKFCRWGQM